MTRLDTFQLYHLMLLFVFWSSVFCILYTYLGYPLILRVLAESRPRLPRESTGLSVGPVSVIIAARNEEARIGRRVRELAQLVRDRPAGGEVLVVSDGSTDRTVEEAIAAGREAEAVPGPHPGLAVRVFELSSRSGKAAALNRGRAEARHDLLVFADARQRWAPDAINRLAAPFSDPTVGAVSGDLILEAASGVLAGVGLYWRFEKWIRRAESRLYSMTSVTGSISAVRRELFRPIPPGTVLDDVYWPMLVVLGGHRVVHEESAKAYDRLPDRSWDEFRRKVRTLAGNFQLIGRIPSILLPWRNPVWWQFVSHRVLRLIVPWALAAVLTISFKLDAPYYRAAFWVQFVCYVFGVAGTLRSVAERSRLAASLGSFLLLNAAAWLAFWVWASGRSSQSWSKINYPVLDRARTSPEHDDGALMQAGEDNLHSLRLR